MLSPIFWLSSVLGVNPVGFQMHGFLTNKKGNVKCTAAKLTLWTGLLLFDSVALYTWPICPRRNSAILVL